MVGGINRLFFDWYGLPHPVVAAVNGHAVAGGLILALCALVSGGVVLGRSAIWKGATVFAGAVVLIVVAIAPMRLGNMHWLAPAVPALGIAIATVCGLIWTYRIEDARARFLLKALGQCISRDVAETLAINPSQLAVGGQRREISVLFSDIQGFTDLTERLREGIEPVLNYYLAEMSHIAFAEDGTIDKFIGDAMMVFWNAPLDQRDHAVRACRTALAIARHEHEIAPNLAAMGATNIRTRIGINTGPVVVGFFGSVERLSYTAIGDAVNLSARLEPANKLYGTQILVSESTQRLAEGVMCFRPIDRLRVYGKTEPAAVYELLGECSDPRLQDLSAGFTRAMAAYYRRDWDAAEGILHELSSRFPGDEPTAALMTRILSYRADPPPPDWDGVFTAKGK
jgi:adenylate cyclase